MVAGLLRMLAAVVHGAGSGPTVPSLTWVLACGMPCIPMLSALSVLSYVDCARGTRNGEPALPPLWTRAVVLAALYLPAHIWVLLVALPYIAFPANWPHVLAAQAALHAAYFAATTRGNPSLTGCRYWPAAVQWFRRRLGPTFSWWMHGCEVRKCFSGELDPWQRYVFAYVPHSMYPAGAAYGPLLPSWTQNFPGVTPVTLTASIMHCVPIMRDVGAWVGFRKVTREAFRRALEVDRHVMMCPGGQTELIYTAEGLRGAAPVVRLCVRHKGFCRLAVEHGAAVVPVIAYGEMFQLHNVVGWRWLLERCYRWLGLPFPYLLCGYGGTPLPDRKPCMFAVGAPVWPGGAVGADGGVGVRELTDDLHKRFYESVIALWHSTRDSASGYEKHRLMWDRQSD
eukprot:jgi/Ulvmu1/5252/UM022_0045.1